MAWYWHSPVACHYNREQHIFRSDLIAAPEIHLFVLKQHREQGFGIINTMRDLFVLALSLATLFSYVAGLPNYVMVEDDSLQLIARGK